MGGGTYCYSSSVTRAAVKGYDTKSTYQIFTERSINNAMSPYGLGIRESRDSAEHPESVAIVLALDVTGSMGSVPHFLVKEGFPKLMDKIIQSGIKDPQVLFLGIGDHECDKAPLQVGQFESSDELLDRWLTSIYLEGGGGGNAGESYLLAWYLAGYHTSIDCLEKRGTKGILFTIGDEPTLPNVSGSDLKNLMGSEQASSLTTHQLLDKVSEKYDVYHIHIAETNAGRMQSTIDGWKQLLADHLIVAAKKTDVSNIIADTILSVYGKKVSTVTGKSEFDDMIL